PNTTHVLVTTLLFLQRPRPNHPPPSFPTRRSSDLSGKVIAAFSDVEGYHDGKDRPASITKGCNIVALGPKRFALVGRDNLEAFRDRKSTRLNSSHVEISYAVFCLKKKND